MRLNPPKPHGWHPLVDGRPPAWASEWGEDRYGVFVGFRVGEVEQRMRWIPSGRFLMGSPESESPRFDSEKPHLVTLSEGLWLADTPVTQELWEEVTGENPSRFVSEGRPVEQVSWADCQAFLEQLNSRVPGLVARLPTEAEWEWACRAGTKAATWVGDLEVLGENNAPALDDIAWYGGNSGVDFDLEEFEDSSGWPNRQYEHEKAGTRRVGLKAANPWGLYDMLGNVFEWCSDWFGDYPDGDSLDPEGPQEGSSSVLRGGSWDSPARRLRAAWRGWYLSGLRYSDLGFRLARGQGRGAPDRGARG